MSLEKILNSLPDAIRSHVREAKSAVSLPTRIAEFSRRKAARPLVMDDLAVLDGVAGKDWLAAFGQDGLLATLGPWALDRLTMVYETSIQTLISTQVVLASTRPLELPGIGAYPSFEVGWTVGFPLGGGERRILVTAGGKLDISGLVFDAPVDLPAFTVHASAERGKVDFARLKQLPLMEGLAATETAPGKARLTDVFVEIVCTPRAEGLECKVDSVAASNSRGDEETWSRPQTMNG